MNFHSKDQKIWFVSDLHLGHAKDFILNPRDYTNVDEALQHMWLTLEETIGPDDIVFNLGDAVVGAGVNSIGYAKRLTRLVCKRQFYLWGNHNAGMKDLYNEAIGEQYPDIPSECYIYPLDYPRSSFTFLGDYAEIFIDKVPIVLTHYPIASWNHMSKGGYNIHGHCHRNMKEDLNLKRLDVGWEWKRGPVEWNDIHRELHSRKSVAPDHHGAGV